MNERSRPRLVVVTDHNGLPEGALDGVKDLVDASVAMNPEQLRAQLPEAEIVLAWDFRAKDLESVWHLASKVRWLSVSAAGVDALMFPSLVQSNVMVTNARGVFDVPMAEYALGLILHFGKRFDVAIQNQREHLWSYHLSEMLAGSTVTVVGLGSIGRTFAGVARAMGMRVLGVRRGGTPDPIADEVFAVDRLHEALGRADYVVIFTPRTPETRGLFDRAAFAAMKPGAVLVNLGRGHVVDEEALVEALRSGHLRGAASDVFAQEPLPADSPLWDAPNHFISPHCGGDDAEANNRILALWSANVRRYLNGEPLQSQVDTRLGY